MNMEVPGQNHLMGLESLLAMGFTLTRRWHLSGRSKYHTYGNYARTHQGERLDHGHFKVAPEGSKSLGHLRLVSRLGKKEGRCLCFLGKNCVLYRWSCTGTNRFPPRTETAVRRVAKMCWELLGIICHRLCLSEYKLRQYKESWKFRAM